MGTTQELFTKTDKLLREVQLNLKVPKNHVNIFGGFRYRKLEDVLEALKPILPEGCTVTFDSEVIEVGGRLFIKSVCSFHTPHGNRCARGWAEIPDSSKKKMDEAQATGAALSYSMKYAVYALFLLDDGVDNDSLMGREEKAAIDRILSLKTATQIKEEMKKIKKEQPNVYKNIYDIAMEIYKEKGGK